MVDVVTSALVGGFASAALFWRQDWAWKRQKRAECQAEHAQQVWQCAVVLLDLLPPTYDVISATFEEYRALPSPLSQRTDLPDVRGALTTIGEILEPRLYTLHEALNAAALVLPKSALKRAGDLERHMRQLQRFCKGAALIGSEVVGLPDGCPQALSGEMTPDHASKLRKVIDLELGPYARYGAVWRWQP